MLQKLPIFLKEIDCKILIKYDGERNNNKYTIRLLYNNLNKGSLGKDTDNPSSTIVEIADIEQELPLQEVIEMFSVITDNFIENSIKSCGERCIATTKLEEKEEQIYYTFHIQIGEKSAYASGLNLFDTVRQVFNQYEEK